MIYQPSYFASTTRVTLALGASFVITSSLFVLMHRLVATDFAEIIDNEPLPLPAVAYEHREEKVILDKKIEKPQEPPVPPEEPEPEMHDYETVDLILPKFGNGVGKPIEIEVMSSGNFPIAQYLGSPIYPANAIRRNIEGFVDVSFNVTSMGATDNVEVVRSQPEGVFEKSAIKAVKRWRFQPLMENGEPKPYKGMVRRITYEMQK